MFDCAFRAANGTRSIHYMGHIRMMAAAQPFLSGAISKTVNLPPDCTVEDIEDAYMEAWKLGLKAVAVYRDGCKRTQPLSTSKTDPGLGKWRVGGRRPCRGAGRERPAGGGAAASCPTSGSRSRTSSRSRATRATSTSACTRPASPGEIFVRMAKEGSTISGLMDSFATAISLALQHGVPLRLLSTSSRARASSRTASPGTRRSRAPARSWTTCSAGWARSS